jgi:hypothetical protein
MHTASFKAALQHPETLCGGLRNLTAKESVGHVS